MMKFPFSFYNAYERVCRDKEVVETDLEEFKKILRVGKQAKKLGQGEFHKVYVWDDEKSKTWSVVLHLKNALLSFKGGKAVEGDYGKDIVLGGFVISKEHEAQINKIVDMIDLRYKRATKRVFDLVEDVVAEEEETGLSVITPKIDWLTKCAGVKDVEPTVLCEGKANAPDAIVFSPAAKKKKCEDLASMLTKHKGQCCDVQIMFSGVFVNSESSTAKISTRVKHIKIAKNRLRVRRKLEAGISSNKSPKKKTKAE